MLWNAPSSWFYVMKIDSREVKNRFYTPVKGVLSESVIVRNRANMDVGDAVWWQCVYFQVFLLGPIAYCKNIRSTSTNISMSGHNGIHSPGALQSSIKRPLTSGQERKLVDYLDQQFLELTRNYKKR